jgi:protein gp37
MDLDWVRSLRDQCVAADVAFFFKQAAKDGVKIPTPELDGRRWTERPI